LDSKNQKPHSTQDNNVWIEIIDDVITQAEYKSTHICEVCGDLGILCLKGSWYKTLCVEHEKVLGYKKVNDD
jgi:hypothetical protein